MEIIEITRVIMELWNSGLPGTKVMIVGLLTFYSVVSILLIYGMFDVIGFIRNRHNRQTNSPV